MIQRIATFVVGLVLLAHPLATSAQIGDLPRSTPEKEGIASERIDNMIRALMSLEKTEIHSVMIARHGKIITEVFPAPFRPEYGHTLYSCSKTFMAAAVGKAIEENRLRLEDRAACFFPEMLPGQISDDLARITIRDLLTMQAGITPDWEMRNNCDNWLESYFAKPVTAPGSKFQYDSMCSYVLSAILQRVTGLTTLEYLNDRLFRHMHITDVAWEKSPEGFSTGGWGLHIQSESMVKFGLLLLNKGMWQGKRLLPQEWVEQMMTPQADTGGEGYGYQMWMCRQHPGAVRADGAFGQYILVIPSHDMVVVLTEATLLDGNTQRDLVFELLGSISPERRSIGDPGRPTHREYALPCVPGKRSGKLVRSLLNHSFKLQDNKFGWKEISFATRNPVLQMHITPQSGEAFTIEFGYKQWVETTHKAYPPYSISARNRFAGIEKKSIVGGSYACPTGSTLRLKAHWINWISSLDILIRTAGDTIRLEVAENCSSQPSLIIEGLRSDTPQDK
ncbi:serine hydrolase [Alistipes sp.]|uniref:serine hydrolase domain-containing protein n=1 Tax=Alistipes sp. TaxID=1872444 RepID=UPI0025C53449|nr:serine hydrolase [Alistipes sp.]